MTGSSGGNGRAWQLLVICRRRRGGIRSQRELWREKGVEPAVCDELGRGAHPAGAGVRQAGGVRALPRRDDAGAGRDWARPGAGGKFFFSPGQVPERVALLKKHLPEEVERTIAEADEILQHRFRLLGYRDLDYGAEIDWHLDAVHGKRAPLKPWYKIPFLDFEQVGDHKIIWELNRHQHLVTLAKAWAFTGDEKYAREVAKQFYSWRAANPYPMGINWGSSLEVAFRSLVVALGAGFAGGERGAAGCA